MKTVTGNPLIEGLSRVPDFRKSRSKRHPLAAILALAIAAVLCGSDNLTAISQWGREHNQCGCSAQRRHQPHSAPRLQPHRT